MPADRDRRRQQDIDTLARELPARHANLFFQLSRDRFDSEIASLRAAVSSLDDAAVVVGMMKIMALVGDSHTGIDPSSFVGFRQLPLRFEWFADGVNNTGGNSSLLELLLVELERRPRSSSGEGSTPSSDARRSPRP